MDNEIITLEGGKPLLDPSIAAQLSGFERQVKEIKRKEDEIKKKIIEAMERAGVLKFDTDELTISYIAPTDRETFDSKSFRKDHADLYDDYVKMSPVKSSIRIKLK